METAENGKTKIRISVRNLVEFILRSGDIDNRLGKGANKEAMLEGSRMHQKIQRRMGADYRAEVSLKIELEEADYIISLEGRADGIITTPEQTVIDEIKCMYTDVTRFEAPIEIHRAQAMCYACIYARQQELEQIGIQITYCSLDTEEIKRFPETFLFEDLDAWFETLIAEYRKWTDFQFAWNQIRRASIQPLEFPFPYREGQKDLAAGVYRTIARKKILFIQAPTGTGKTISTVFPAVKAVGEGLGDKIFYLTAKTITRTVAKDAFDLLKSRGYQGKVLTITAKEKLCPCEEMDCNPENCPCAKGHYDRVNDAVYELVTGESDFTREVLLKQAQKYQVCPFEMALDAALWSDVIICDYNYVFDPNIYLKRFFADGVRGEYLFLIDEAHNLVERGRKMYSALLVKEDILKLKRILQGHSRKLTSVLEQCNRQMLEWKRECEDYHTYESIGSFAFTLMRLASLLDTFLQERGDFPERREVSDFYLNLRHFMNMFERMDENYVLYTDFDGDGQFCLHLYCVNPALNLQECLDRGNSAVFFSATLLPISYYKKLLSSREDNYAVYATSVFQEEQRLLLVGRDVSSLYKRRNTTEFQKIASYIYQTAKAKRGNYIAFFPSYKFMEEVYQQFLALNPGEMDCVLQSSGMQEAEREAFMEAFSEQRAQSLVGFCVLGGIFSEGIDLKNEQLIGVLIVGTGLPQICSEREILRNYYEEESRQGFAYAYLYPGMNKVLQAAGRVIRTAQDCGVIVLLDERFLRNDYKQLFPLEWQDYQVHTLKSLPEALTAFWEGKS